MTSSLRFSSSLRTLTVLASPCNAPKLNHALLSFRPLANSCGPPARCPACTFVAACVYLLKSRRWCLLDRTSKRSSIGVRRQGRWWFSRSSIPSIAACCSQSISSESQGSNESSGGKLWVCSGGNESKRVRPMVRVEPTGSHPPNLRARIPRSPQSPHPLS